MCTSCLTDYTFNEGLCTFCGIPNCQSCSAFGVCATCSNITTFYNAGSSCLFCYSDCAVCSDNKVCSQCNDTNKRPNLIG